MTTLYVSPHLDDAAWSCAGGIVQRVDVGRDVVVCTVFTGGHDDRRREDTTALERVGARWQHLEVDDATRRPRSFRSLVLDAEPAPHVVDAIVGAVRRAAAEVHADELFFPLGIGGHVDHRAVFLASRSFAGARYYEDRPYAFVPAFVQLRRLELEGGDSEEPASAAEIEAQCKRGGCAAMFEAGEREACFEALADRLRSRHAGCSVQIVTDEVTRCDRGHTIRALELVRGYASQIAWLGVGDRVASLWAPEGVLIERSFVLR